MSTQSLFPTLVYRAPLGLRGVTSFNRDLLDEGRRIRDQDVAGQRWSKTSYPGGYTSYGSLDQLHQMSSTFIRLREGIDRHVQRFARDLRWELGGGQLAMTDCWINFMPRGVAHSLHLHPQAVVSGTYYVKVPARAPGLKFEDPALSRMMAAPPRKGSRPSHVTCPARAGHLILFESWLRHEVATNTSAGERVSISFNYHWL